MLAGNASSLTIAAGGSGKIGLTLTPSGGYSGTIAMSCSTTMANVSCSFSPASYTADGSNTALTGSVTIASTSTAELVAPQFGAGRGGFALAMVWWVPAGLLVVLAGGRRKHGLVLLVTMGALLAVAAGLTACSGGGGSGGGGGGGGGGSQVTGTVTVVATGSTGSVTQSLNVTVTVQ